MDLKESILKRRSIRNFKEEQVPEAKIKELLEVSSHCGTGSGQEPWGVCIIQDKEELKTLSNQAKIDWLKDWEKYPYMHFEPYRNWMENPDYNIFYNAPTVVLIYGNPESHWYVYDSSLLASNLMFLAPAEGLGTCWIGFAEFICNNQSFKKAHGVPASWELVAPLIIGYPKAEPRVSKRKPITYFK